MHLVQNGASKMNEKYYHTEESVQEYIRLAADVDGSALINRLKHFLSEGSKVLELGSGPGTDYHILSKHYQVTGSDLSEVFLKHLRSQYPSGKFLHLSASNLATKNTFHGIYSNKVLHHLHKKELLQSVDQQHNILDKEGIICHSFWKGKGEESYKGMQVSYYTESELQQIFEKQFKLLLLEAYAEFEDGDSLLLIAKRKDL